jgi:antitoxin MazE
MVMAVKVVESKITKIGNMSIKKENHITLPKGIDEEFLEQMNDMMKEYNETFKGLVNR